MEITTTTATQAWSRIMFGLLFGFVLFWTGMLLHLSTAYFLSNFFFILVGIFVYFLIDAFIYFFISHDVGYPSAKIYIVGSVFALLLNMVFFYGFLFFF